MSRKSTNSESDKSRIGELAENHLHKALKYHYAGESGAVEQKVGNYIVDVVFEHSIVEIQTANFSGFRTKLNGLLSEHKVKVVLPLLRRLTLQKIDIEGEVSRRKSPRSETLADAFVHLSYIAKLLCHPNLTLDFAFVHVEETREYLPRRKRWQKQFKTTEKQLVGIYEIRTIESFLDLYKEFEAQLAMPFSTKDLAVVLNRPTKLARRAAYCFRESGITQQVGKQGNALLYASTSASD